MKELSIEKKAKRYDKAIERAEGLIDFCSDSELKTLEYVFPELKESEDEQSKKWILEYLYDGLRKSDEQFKGQFKAAIAWVEKQGEQKVSYTTLVETGNGGINALVTRELSTNYCDDEQKPTDKVEPKFKVGQTIKKESFNLGFTIVKIEDGFYYNDMGDYFPFTDQDNWVLVEQKPAWSEEEIEKAANEWNSKANFNPFYMTMDGDKPTGVKQDITTHKESFKAGVNWILKSLRPQNRWKPSDKQMEILRKSFKCVSLIDAKILSSLYDELKKLREE